ncbi:MAG UNVERIFIED_CONTAM: hypothetical protein LVR18_52565 [Planctomycetaceae bacterium]
MAVLPAGCMEAGQCAATAAAADEPAGAGERLPRGLLPTKRTSRRDRNLQKLLQRSQRAKL